MGCILAQRRLNEAIEHRLIIVVFVRTAEGGHLQTGAGTDWKIIVTVHWLKRRNINTCNMSRVIENYC